MTFGLLRVKNEARWIGRVLESLRPVCDRIIVWDDHSEDETREICRAAGAEVIESPFDGLDEGRDKDALLAHVYETAAIGDWCLLIDGDELVYQADVDAIRALTAGRPDAYSFRVVYLWDSDTQWRVDGVYGRFRRPSMFRLIAPGLRFRRTGNGGNFHCGSIPYQLESRCQPAGVRLLHLGYRDRADRLRKFAWYNAKDPGNVAEDYYRHMIQGDLPEVPARARLRHAGPLTLAPLEAA